MITNRHSWPQRVLAAVSSLTFVTLSACYAYSPVDEGRPESGDNVRLRLNEEGTRRIGEESFLDKSATVEGLLIRLSSSAYHVVVTAPARQSFRAGGVRQDTVSIATNGVMRVEAKRLQTVRTIALTGSLTIGAFALGAALASGAEGSGGGLPPGEGGGDVTIVVPLPVP